MPLGRLAIFRVLRSLSRRFFVPLGRFGGIFFYPQNALLIKQSKNDLGARVALRRRFAEPLQALGGVFRNFCSIRIGFCQIELSFGISGLGFTEKIGKVAAL